LPTPIAELGLNGYEKMKVPDKRSIRLKTINTKLIVAILT
jgi:hypothetical protein